LPACAFAGVGFGMTVMPKTKRLKAELPDKKLKVFWADLKIVENLCSHLKTPNVRGRFHMSSLNQRPAGFTVSHADEGPSKLSEEK
jgi:hypothetical protein